MSRGRRERHDDAPRPEVPGWPAEAEPAEAWIFSHVERLVPAAPDQLWPWLVHARSWPRWYANAGGVRLPSGAEVLELGTVFRWRTFGVRITSRVTTYDPMHAIGWHWERAGGWGYHGWLLEPHPLGTRVVTEESQLGPGPRLLRPVLAPVLDAGHAYWVRALASVAVGRAG